MPLDPTIGAFSRGFLSRCTWCKGGWGKTGDPSLVTNAALTFFPKMVRCVVVTLGVRLAGLSQTIRSLAGLALDGKSKAKLKYQVRIGAALTNRLCTNSQTGARRWG